MSSSLKVKVKLKPNKKKKTTTRKRKTESNGSQRRSKRSRKQISYSALEGGSDEEQIHEDDFFEEPEFFNEEEDFGDGSESFSSVSEESSPPATPPVVQEGFSHGYSTRRSKNNGVPFEPLLSLPNGMNRIDTYRFVEKRSKRLQLTEEEISARKAEQARRRKLIVKKEAEESKNAVVKKLISSQKKDTKLSRHIKSMYEPSQTVADPTIPKFNPDVYTPRDKEGKPILRYISSQKKGTILLIPKDVDNVSQFLFTRPQ